MNFNLNEALILLMNNKRDQNSAVFYIQPSPQTIPIIEEDLQNITRYIMIVTAGRDIKLL